MSYITSHSSPNHSPRNGTAISMIVLHATVGSFASSLAWLTDPLSRVSSHYLLDKAGNVYQLVADSDAAWHAGKSAWKGLASQAIEDCSLGIELENANNGKDPYPAVQIQAAHDLCAQKIARYHITRDMLTRHLDIAIPKGRKTDPAGFPWAQFVEGLYPMTPTPPPPPTAPPTMPLPVVQTYTVKGVPLVGLVVYQAQSLTGAVAGFLPQGSTVEIDMLYDGDVGHVKGGLGFVSLKGLQVGPL